ncbi:MAG: glycosyltransferase family 39 protein [Staphylothermus sp.]|nr:glycosyltransferase family 39 protein [Staphylothermus sp.]
MIPIINRCKQYRIDILYIGLISMFTLVFYTYYLFREPLVYGIDGPYYLIQIRWIFDHGSMYYGDPPLTFYLMYLLYLIIRNDILTVKIFVLLTIFSSSILIYYGLRRFIGLDNLSSIVISLIYALSPNMIRMSGDFIKNVFGLLLLIIYLLLLMRYNKSRLNIYGFLLLYMSGLSTLLTHVLAFGMLIVYTIALLFILMIRRGLRNNTYLFALVLSFIATSLIAYYIDPFHFNDLEKFMYYTRLGEEVHLQPLGFPQVPRRPSIFGDVMYLCVPLCTLSIAIFYLVHTLQWEKIYSIWLLVNTVMLVIMLNPLLEYQVFIRLVYASILPAVFIQGIVAKNIGDHVCRHCLLLGLLVIVVITGLSVASTWGSVISYDEYLELEHIKETIIESTNTDQYYIIPRGIPHYWAQYVFSPQHVIHSPKTCPKCIDYIVLSKKLGISPLRPNEKIVFDGKYFQVRRIIITPYTIQ